MQNNSKEIKSTQSFAVVETKNAKGEKINLSDKLKSLIESKIFDSVKFSAGSSVNSKKELYIYPENIKSEIDKKRFRVKTRNLVDAILYAIKFHNSDSDILQFLKIYSERYKIQNFELDSITQSKNAKIKDYQIALNTVKNYLSK